MHFIFLKYQILLIIIIQKTEDQFIISNFQSHTLCLTLIKTLHFKVNLEISHLL